MAEIIDLSVKELRDSLKRKELSSSEVVSAYQSRIKKLDGKVGSYLHINEEAPKQAQSASSSNGPLAGVPVGIKDLLCTKGMPTTCASKILEGWRPPYNAHVVEKLYEAGTVPLGKLNMDEFAMGSSNENSYYKPCRNPWDLDRVPGGSSGGSAAAVSARLAPFTLGSDTGGSIRQPAALCGVVGLKPTYGRVSRYGLIAFASSLDQIGPLTRTVEDSAIVMNVIAGHDGRDTTSAPVPVPDYTKSLTGEIKGMKIGLPEEYFAEGIEPNVAERVKSAVKQFESLGAEIIPLKLPHTPYAVAVYYLLATAEASSNLARFDGVQYGFRAPGVSGLIEMYMKTRAQGFGSEVKRRIMLGTYALSAGYYDAYYKKAQQVRTLIKRDFDQAFERVDVIATPTSPTPAFKLGEKVDDPLTMYLSDICTISINLAGIPGMSLPCGFVEREGKSLPVGLQLLAKPFGEEAIFKVAHAYEKSTDHARLPEVI